MFVFWVMGDNPEVIGAIRDNWRLQEKFWEIGCNQGQSEAIRANRGQSKPIRANWGQSNPIRANWGQLGPIRANRG